MLRSVFLLLAVLCASSASAALPVKVVTTLPDLADWVREIGGARVEVRSLLQGFENPHTYEPKVSDVKAVAGARVLVTVGLGLEEWLDGLVENARNSALLQVEASEGVPVLGDGGAEESDRGHAHAHGNPHVWLDPDNAESMCRNIARALEVADPAGASVYRDGLAAYVGRLQEVAGRLRREAGGLPDRRFIAYHASWPYFARSLGLEQAAVVAPIPGQEPSAKAVSELIARIRAEKLRVLVTEPQLSSKLPEVLSQEAGIRVVTLSTLLGAGPAKSYLELLEANARELIAALREPPR